MNYFCHVFCKLISKTINKLILILILILIRIFLNHIIQICSGITHAKELNGKPYS